MSREDPCSLISKNHTAAPHTIVTWCDYSVSLILMRCEGVSEPGKRGKEGVGCEPSDPVQNSMF